MEKEEIMEFLSLHYESEEMKNTKVFYANLIEHKSKEGKVWGWEDSEQYEIPCFTGYIEDDTTGYEIIQTENENSDFIVIVSPSRDIIDTVRQKYGNRECAFTCYDELAGTHEGDVYIINNTCK